MNGANSRTFGATRRTVAAVGQGSWKIETEAASAIAALRRGLDLGLTHIDTAEMYGSGAAESLIAEAMAGRRDEVFLVSKVLPTNASKRGTIAACNQSLARLRTDRLDCYLLHWRGSHPLEETVAAFDSRTKHGRVLHEIAAAHGSTPRQAALRFLLRNPETFVIPKASSLEHVEENAAALHLELSTAELARIDAAFPLGKPRRGLPMI